ncbi:hypothetical protein RHMOL_Rhmol03G0256300 [Rhododendron molle]|uniref:Uncharacterized protein n=1 Tax=Rhododendron molle TaxID=49168 RepID=A0ACC0PLL9_RHOML|nr:hypothetical protein RHMOL_Rhmol03G0256300 [Rhododendron molle]
MGLQLNWLAVKLFAIAVALLVQGSTGYGISPSPATFSTIPSIKEGPPDHANRSNAPSPASQPHVLHPPPVLGPLVSPPEPQPIIGVAPSLSPSTPTVFPPQSSIPPPLTGRGVVPSLPPSVPGTKEPKNKDPVTLPVAPATLPPMKSPENPPTFYPIVPGSMPPSSRQNKAPDSNAPLSVPSVPVPTTSPPKELPQNPPPPKEPIMPGVPPSNFPVVPVASPPTKLLPISPTSSPPIPMKPPSHLPEPDNSPVLTPSPSATQKGAGIPVAAPPNETPNQFSPVNPSPQKAPSVHKAPRHFNNSVPPISSPMSPPPNIESDSPALPPTSNHKHHHAKDNIPNPAPLSLLLPPPASSPSFAPAPSHPLKSHPKSRQRDHAPPPMNRESHVSPAPVPAPYPAAPSGQTNMPFLFPKISPSGSLPRNPKMPISPPIRALPPPPPNEDCSYLACVDPLTNTPPGSPCGCVLPMQVGLRLNVALYTFFPSVSELAEEIAVGVFVKQSQVRIMGANAASQDPEKTIVLIDLVPLEERFDNTTAYLIFQRFWQKQVAISTSLFGNFEILYVRYPGLPPSPPSSISVIDGAPYSGHDNNGRTIHPLGVDVGRQKHKNGLSGSVVAIIVLSASMAVILCCAVAWVLLFRHRDCQQDSTPATLPSLSKPSGITASMFGSGPTSASPSFVSSIGTYTGSAKTFSSSNLKKATDNFNASKILGEGGFGRVYNGVLEDGTKVAVKVLKRDDQQGGRDDRLTAPLDWGSRVKIALGAARGLAYLHEDSSPRVIHRDFKSSNILLEHDFTPKVSDFGLARTALDEENRHISTRVMGTFGYVAPEYAMTGHLLVKSDVYSYGVVLLELLTGRKPVDMSQPPGQENLVSWARSLLTSKEALESIIDPSLGPDFPFDSIAKVAAIASMCVQPEVSHRPFMGEVVQALKLVCNESDDTKEFRSRSCSQEDLSADMDARISANSGQLIDPLQNHSPVSNYDYGSDVERGISTSDLFGSSKMLVRSESFRRHSSLGPRRSGRRRQLWQKMRRLSGGTVSEHGVFFKLWPGSY